MQLTITRSEIRPTPRGALCTVWLQTEDNKTVPHLFPLETLEWRAAEYGINPADTDTLLDIVLHEPHGEPSTLYDDPDTDTARQRHLDRIAKTKRSVQVVPQAPAKGTKAASPLQPIKDAHTALVDPQEVALKAQAVQARRDALRGRQTVMHDRRPRSQEALPAQETPRPPFDPTLAARAAGKE